MSRRNALCQVALITSVKEPRRFVLWDLEQIPSDKRNIPTDCGVVVTAAAVIRGGATNSHLHFSINT